MRRSANAFQDRLPRRRRLLVLAVLAGLVPRAAVAGRVELVSRADPALLSDTPSPRFLPHGSLLIPASAAVSADGRYVAFGSPAANLLPGLRTTPVDPASAFYSAYGVDQVYLYDRVAGTITLVSHRSGALDTAGNLGSGDVVLSADGRFVAYLSEATDLVPGQVDSNLDLGGFPSGRDLFLWDRVTGSTALVTHQSGTSATTADQATLGPVAISADGGWLAFESMATNLVSGQSSTPDLHDVFLYERATGTNTLVSHASGAPGTAAGGNHPTLSADGRFVTFLSPPFSPAADLFLYDRTSGLATLVSHAAGAPGSGTGGVSNGRISADGSHVAFSSKATNLVPGQVDANGVDDVFLYDRTSGVTSLVSGAGGSATTTADGASSAPLPSADGRRVAFTSGASNLVPGQTGAAPGTLFLDDASVGASTLVSHTSASSLTPEASGVREFLLSEDGSALLFLSLGTDLMPGQAGAGATPQAFLYAPASGTTALLSHPPGLPGTASDGSASVLRVSADGGTALFWSFADDLVAGVHDFNFAADLVLFDRTAGTLALVTRRAPGTPCLSASANGSVFADGTDVSTSADGRYVAFTSTAANLVAGQESASGQTNVFLYDRTTGGMILVSHADGAPATPGDAGSGTPVVSADGGSVVFWSAASNLVAGETSGGGVDDLFLYDRTAGTTVLVSHAAGSPTTATAGPSSQAALSADGRFVVYQSYAENLVTGQSDTNFRPDVFVWDRQSGTTTLVSHRAGFATGTSHDGASAPGISADGGTIAFSSTSFDLLAGNVNPGEVSNVYLADRVSGTLTLVSHAAGLGTAADGDSGGSTLSADGRFLAFGSAASNLVPGQSGGGSGAFNLFLFDRDLGTTALVSHTPGSPTAASAGSSSQPSMSADGRYLGFASTGSDLVAGDATGLNIFLYDRMSSAVTLVSRRAGGALTGVGGSAPVLSADGSHLAFLSVAADLVPGQAPPALDFFSDPVPSVFLYDRTTGTTAIASRSLPSATAGGNSGSHPPRLDADGGVVVFSSDASDLVPGDLNSNGDVFVYTYGLGRTGVYWTVPPCRLLDTRQGPALASGTPAYLTVHGACGIPATAGAIALNVTVTGATAAGHLTLYPGDGTLPATSTINFGAGQTRANNAILRLSENGDGVLALSPFVLGSGKVDVIVDVSGYFE